MIFFSFCVVFNNFFTMPVDTENARLNLALAIPTGAPIAVENDAIEMQIKQLKIYQNNQNKQCVY